MCAGGGRPSRRIQTRSGRSPTSRQHEADGQRSLWICAAFVPIGSRLQPLTSGDHVFTTGVGRDRKRASSVRGMLERAPPTLATRYRMPEEIAGCCTAPARHDQSCLRFAARSRGVAGCARHQHELVAGERWAARRRGSHVWALAAYGRRPHHAATAEVLSPPGIDLDWWFARPGMANWARAT